MRLTCPLCGPRDRREFYYAGAADLLARPVADAPPAAWDAYLHLRDNRAGRVEDLWYHEQGCAQWLRVTRDTVTHAIYAVALVAPNAPAAVPDAPSDASGGGISAKMKPGTMAAPDARAAAPGDAADASGRDILAEKKPAGRKKAAEAAAAGGSGGDASVKKKPARGKKGAGDAA